MARRPRRRRAALLIALSLGACAPRDAASPAPSVAAPTTSGAPTSTTAAPLPTTTTTTPITTASDSTTTSGGDASPSTTNGPVEIDAEVVVPGGDGPFPAVVLVHGGGWVAGDPSIMGPLASHLNENGILTVNTRYRLSTLDRPGFPGAVEDVACAVNYAAGHPESNGSVAVVGHSAGAHIGAIVALTGGDYPGDCPFTGPGVPARFVGLAGPYDVTRIGPVLAVFFGESSEADPDTWSAGNPQELTDENPELDSLIMYGELDGLIDDRFAFDFHDALQESGSSSLLELVEGARHNDMHDPDLVGELIVTWLHR